MAITRGNGFPVEAQWRLLLKDLGVSAHAILRRAELPADLFSREGVLLTTSEYFRLWRAMETEVDDPVLPLRIVEAFTTEAFHPVLFASLCSSDYAVAVNRIAQYKRLVAPMELRVQEDDRGLDVEVRWLDATVEPPASLVVFELAFLARLARIGTRERIEPRAVETAAGVDDSKSLEDFFGTRIRLGKRHALTFSLTDAHRPFLTENQSMWQLFESRLRQRLADLDADATITDRVRATLLEALPAGESSMDHVARKLAISKRTLQRRLREDGTTFQEVLADVREALARHYLERTTLSGAEISYLLGFEDPNSFSRAFHAWTGKTPEQLRSL